MTIPTTPIIPDPPNRAVSGDSRRRGQWGHLPDDNPSNVAGLERAYSVAGGSVHSDQLTKHRKPSLRTLHPLSQPSRESGSNTRHAGRLSTYALSVAPSSFVSKFGPHMKTLKNLLRNEVRAAPSVAAFLNVTIIAHSWCSLQQSRCCKVSLQFSRGPKRSRNRFSQRIACP